MKIWAIAQLKGGVGKTTSAINIARALNKEHGQRVLLCEVSKQGNIGEFFGYKKVLSMEDVIKKPEMIPLAICHTDFAGLDYIPASMYLLNIEINTPYNLKKAFERVQDQYDYVVIDCEPSFDMAVLSAFTAADQVFMPLKLDQYAIDAISKMCAQLDEVREINKRLTLAGIFVTMYTNTKYNRAELERLRQEGSFALMATVIRRSVKVDETSGAKKPLLDYSPRCNASKDYIALVEEMLSL